VPLSPSTFSLSFQKTIHGALLAYQIIQSTKLNTQVDIECTVKNH
jgi:uncharacterized surface anchored protein